MSVFTYRSTDFGAPALQNVANRFVEILDACLVTGYGSLSLTSLTRSGSLVTAITSTNHGYSTLFPAHLTISGSLDPAYNGSFLCTITGANSFTYNISGNPNSPASGVLSVKRSPAGWTKPFVGTNAAAFKQPEGSNGFYLYVQDDGSTYGFVYRGYETMSDISTGTNPFPTVAQSSSPNVIRSAASWTLITNGKMLYFFMDTPWRVSMAFGDITSFKIGDLYHTILVEGSSSEYLSRTDANYSSRYLARAYTQIAGSILAAFTSDRICHTNSGYNSGYVFPEPVTGGLLLAPIYVSEVSGARRGVLPGCWCVLHNIGSFSNGDTIYGSGELAGKLFMICYSGNGCLAMEVSDTW